MRIGTRVQIPAFYDRWMRGDRYGTVEKVYRPAGNSDCHMAKVHMDKCGRVCQFPVDELEELS